MGNPQQKSNSLKCWPHSSSSPIKLKPRPSFVLHTMKRPSNLHAVHPVGRDCWVRVHGPYWAAWSSIRRRPDPADCQHCQDHAFRMSPWFKHIVFYAGKIRFSWSDSTPQKPLSPSHWQGRSGMLDYFMVGNSVQRGGWIYIPPLSYPPFSTSILYSVFIHFLFTSCHM